MGVSSSIRRTRGGRRARAEPMTNSGQALGPPARNARPVREPPASRETLVRDSSVRGRPGVSWPGKGVSHGDVGSRAHTQARTGAGRQESAAGLPSTSNGGGRGSPRRWRSVRGRDKAAGRTCADQREGPSRAAEGGTVKLGRPRRVRRRGVKGREGAANQGPRAGMPRRGPPTPHRQGREGHGGQPPRRQALPSSGLRPAPGRRGA